MLDCTCVISSSELKVTCEQFWKAVEIWNCKPHVINRRLAGCIHIISFELDSFENGILEKLYKIFCEEYQDLNFEGITSDKLLSLLSAKHVNVKKTVEIDTITNGPGCYLSFKKLIPRNHKKFTSSYELSLLDHYHNRASFVVLGKNEVLNSLSPKFPFIIEFNERKISLSVIGTEIDNPNVKWLRDNLFPKLVKWATEDLATQNISSLSLVCIDRYMFLYHQLKEKYGPELVKIWPERTDPSKFVYEDIAIATYILLIWEIERNKTGCKKQTFLDLGCGNGLLVYILDQEGFSGKGIDIRKRGIWDLYPKSTCLEESPIIPSLELSFPDVDWLIGNHSDELTPWIPVIASRSSYKCNFFLLPCCSYELDGKKYQRSNSSCSQYLDYFNYITKVCEMCGFNVSLDKLRIPSTKRNCIVSMGRNYDVSQHEEFQLGVIQLISKRCCSDVQEGSEKVKSNLNRSIVISCKLRSKYEKVRNCTQLNKNLVSNIVRIITKKLLTTERKMFKKADGKLWNGGGVLRISELVSIIPKEMLKDLKNECGGLQTLMKNHSYIFKVINGTVQLKSPFMMNQKDGKPKSKNKIRQGKPHSKSNVRKDCWFFNNHPDGCPFVNEDDCGFLHSTIKKE